MNAFYRIPGKWSWSSSWIPLVTGNSPPFKEPTHFWASVFMWKSYILPSGNLPAETFGLWLCHPQLHRAMVQDGVPHLPCKHTGGVTLGSSHCIEIYHSQESMTMCVSMAPRAKIPASKSPLLSRYPHCIPHGHSHSARTQIWACDLVSTKPNTLHWSMYHTSFHLGINFDSLPSNIQIITCWFSLLTASQVHPLSLLHAHCHDSSWGHHYVSKMLPSSSPVFHLVLSIPFTGMELKVMLLKGKVGHNTSLPKTHWWLSLPCGYSHNLNHGLDFSARSACSPSWPYLLLYSTLQFYAPTTFNILFPQSAILSHLWANAKSVSHLILTPCFYVQR